MPKLSTQDQFPVTNESVAAVLESWNIQDFEMEPVKFGIENTTLIIQTKQDKKVLRIYRQRRKDVRDLHDEVSFTLHLRAHGLPVPDLYTTRTGARVALTSWENKEWLSLLMEYKEGHHPSAYTSDIVYELGKALAKLHEASLKYVCAHQMPADIAEDLQYEIRKVEASHASTSAFLARAKHWQAPPGTLPSAHIHGDLMITNTLWVRETLNAIVDFDDTEYQWLILDVAISLWHIFFLSNDAKLLRTFLQGYTGIRPLLPEEKAALIPLLQAVNYTRGIDQILLDALDTDWTRIQEVEKVLPSFSVQDLF